ncbi:hypothetical protein [Burkholderia metallica]|nr:hypothetical protein [Burkholderia metallica]
MVMPMGRKNVSRVSQPDLPQRLPIRPSTAAQGKVDLRLHLAWIMPMLL